jgi:hypothetical protein
MTDVLTGALVQNCTLPPYGYGIYQYDNPQKGGSREKGH